MTLSLTHTHTRQPDYTAHYLLQNNNKKNPRRDNIAGDRPDCSSDINNEDPQAAHKPHILPPKTGSLKNSP